MKSDRVSIVLAFGIILAVLLSINAVWATPEQSADRQTVPTQTPKESTPVSRRRRKIRPRLCRRPHDYADSSASDAASEPHTYTQL